MTAGCGFPSPCDNVEEAEDEVEDPCRERLIQESGLCRFCPIAPPTDAWWGEEPSSSDADDVSDGAQTDDALLTLLSKHRGASSEGNRCHGYSGRCRIWPIALSVKSLRNLSSSIPKHCYSQVLHRHLSNMSIHSQWVRQQLWLMLFIDGFHFHT